jgi:GNAT superfamily N-acetyltransferase
MTHPADDVRTEIRRLAELDERELDRIRGLLRAVWPHVDVADFEHRHPDMLAAAWDGDELVSFLAIVERIVSVGGRLVPVGGIGGVVTLPEQQGKGLATLVTERAREHLESATDVRFGFLRCQDELLPFYARLGWQRIEASVTYLTTPSTPPADNAMVQPLRGECWPAGDVDLRGTAW